MPDKKKRVLIVDDSVFARKIVSDILAGSPELEVVGVATNGLDALSKIDTLKPDVITLDVEMPQLDGIGTLRRIMSEKPTPVVMVSSLTAEGARESMLALSLGAVDVMAKPHGTHSIGLTAQADDLIAKVLAAACIEPGSLKPLVPSAQRQQSMPPKAVPRPARRDFPVVIIASSTGGPRALRMVVPELAAASDAAFIIIQHLPQGFSASLAKDLDNICALRVYEAAEGSIIHPGEVAFAKAGSHLVISHGGRMTLTQSAPLWGVRPSADVTMVSSAPIYGSRLVGVVLTGMGHDGSNGLRAIKESGGTTIAEHESTCMVYGMPRSAIELGVVDVIAPIQRIPEAINAAVLHLVSRAA